MALPIGVIGLTIDSVVPDTYRYISTCLIVTMLGGMELSGRGAELPQNRRVVPQGIYLNGRQFGAIQFGFEMGTGVRTFVTTSIPAIALVVGLRHTSQLLSPFVLMLGFAGGRAMPIPARALSQNGDRWERELRQYPLRFSVPLLVGALLITLILVLRPTEL